MARLSRLLDTNVCVCVIRRRPPEVLGRFEDFEVGEIGISAITACELFYGVEKSLGPKRNREALKRFLLPLEVLSFDPDAAASYGRVRASFEERGTPAGPLDTLIAAHALSLGTILVTNNTREFGRVPDLNLEDWTGS